MPELNQNTEIKIDRYIIPWDVSITKNPDDETFEIIAEFQKKFLSLPGSVQDKLVSKKTGEKIQSIGMNFGLSMPQIANIARAVRSYYFGELKLEDLPFYLAKEIPIDLSKAQEISRMVIEKIINDRSIEQARQAELESTTLSDALKKYPEIGEQLITSDRINIKSFPEPARPSIKNWLADYTFVLGYGTHDAIARANYMFQGTNARNLASTDRERLAYILKSYDENTLVTVDKNEKKIVFPTSDKRQEPPRSDLGQANDNSKVRPLNIPQAPSRSDLETASTTKISYSSPQKLPYEKMRTQQQPYRITPIYGQQKKEEPKKDERILNKNVVDLRDSM